VCVLVVWRRGGVCFALMEKMIMYVVLFDYASMDMLLGKYMKMKMKMEGERVSYFFSS